MQKKVQIISDGSQDLSPELSKEKDIEVVPFYVSFDGEHYYKEIEEITVRDFYQQMVDHPDVFPKTSMPSVQDFYEVFEKSVKENIPVICICITAKFSGSLQSATTAKDMILEEYPEAKIAVIDSTFDTVLQGLFVLEACRLRDLGLEYEQITEALLSIRESGRIFLRSEHRLLKAWRTHWKACRNCGQCVENQTYHHTEGGRNFQFRHYQKPSEIDAEGCGDDGKIPG